MFLDEGDQVGRTHLLLSLGEDDHVHGKTAPGGQVGLQRLDMEEKLPLVVRGTAGVDPSVADLGFEGRSESHSSSGSGGCTS